MACLNQKKKKRLVQTKHIVKLKKKKKHNFSTLMVLYHPLRLGLYNSMHAPVGFI